jgi:hypothetical protein
MFRCKEVAWERSIIVLRSRRLMVRLRRSVNTGPNVTPFHRLNVDPPGRGHRSLWVVISVVASPPGRCHGLS